MSGPGRPLWREDGARSLEEFPSEWDVKSAISEDRTIRSTLKVAWPFALAILAVVALWDSRATPAIESRDMLSDGWATAAATVSREAPPEAEGDPLIASPPALRPAAARPVVPNTHGPAEPRVAGRLSVHSVPVAMAAHTDTVESGHLALDDGEEMPDLGERPIAFGGAEAEVEHRAAIDTVLDVYRQAYATLDVTLMSTVWVGLDTRALQRAFDGLRQQQVSFDRCDVTLVSNKAQAACVGVVDYTRKVGASNWQRRHLSWDIDFSRAAGRWVISGVRAR